MKGVFKRPLYMSQEQLREVNIYDTVYYYIYTVYYYIYDTVYYYIYDTVYYYISCI